MHRRRRHPRAPLAVVILVGLAVLLAVSLVLGGTAEEDPDLPANLQEGWYARIDTTKGRIVALLLPEQAPQSVAHFAALAEGRLEWFDRIAGEIKKGPYYDGIKVHKVIAGGHFEAGDPLGVGRGAPDLFVPLEGLGPVNFGVPGRLGMTRSGGRISAVQFFATASGTPWLNRNHPCFGVIVSGLEVVEAITQEKAFSNGRPVEPPVIESLRIFSVGDPAPLPEPEPWRPPYGELRERPGMLQTEPD